MDAARKDAAWQDILRHWIVTGWIPAILALLTVLFMMPFIDPLTSGAALDGSDLRNQVYPLTSLIFDHVRDGKGVPLWNPYQFAGQSIATNPQSSLFYPFAWVMVLLGVPRGAGWLLGFHLWWGGCGFALFARRIGASSAGALAGGSFMSFRLSLLPMSAQVISTLCWSMPGFPGSRQPTGGLASILTGCWSVFPAQWRSA